MAPASKGRRKVGEEMPLALDPTSCPWETTGDLHGRGGICSGLYLLRVDLQQRRNILHNPGKGIWWLSQGCSVVRNH